MIELPGVLKDTHQPPIQVDSSGPQTLWQITSQIYHTRFRIPRLFYSWILYLAGVLQDIQKPSSQVNSKSSQVFWAKNLEDIPYPPKSHRLILKLHRFFFGKGR